MPQVIWCNKKKNVNTCCSYAFLVDGVHFYSWNWSSISSFDPIFHKHFPRKSIGKKKIVFICGESDLRCLVPSIWRASKLCLPFFNYMIQINFFFSFSFLLSLPKHLFFLELFRYIFTSKHLIAISNDFNNVFSSISRSLSLSSSLFVCLFCVLCDEKKISLSSFRGEKNHESDGFFSLYV